MRFLRLLCVLAVAATVCVPGHSRAHPHAWIDLETTLVMNDSAQVIALSQYWLFGDFYSSYVIGDIQSSGQGLEDGLRDTARNNLLELEAYDYFTRVTADGEPAAYERVEIFETGIIDGRIYLKFTLELEAPLDPIADRVRYAVFDPTYYVEVLYAEGATPQTAGAENLGCRTTVTAPQPTFEEMAYAASLDQTESGGDGLGELFAEWVTLDCL